MSVAATAKLLRIDPKIFKVGKSRKSSNEFGLKIEIDKSEMPSLIFPPDSNVEASSQELHLLGFKKEKQSQGVFSSEGDNEKKTAKKQLFESKENNPRIKEQAQQHEARKAKAKPLKESNDQVSRSFNPFE